MNASLVGELEYFESPQLPLCLKTDRTTGTQSLSVPSTPPVQAPPQPHGIIAVTVRPEH